MRKWLVALMGSMAVASCAYSADLPSSLQEGLLFHLDFEERVEAVRSEGDSMAQGFSGDAHYVDGVRGKAVSFGDGKTPSLKYSNEGNLSMAEGTVAFWVKPMGWEQSETAAIPLFQQGVAHKGYFGVNASTFSGGPRSVRFFSQKLAQRSDIVISADPDWPRGIWRHVVVSWDSDAVRLYTDRGLVKEVSIPRSYELADFDWSTFVIGSSIADTAIDEFRIWSRVLTDREIAELQEFESSQPGAQ